MAYVTGTANSLGDLLTALQEACTSNGWTLAGNVLYKGDCYVAMAVSGAVISLQGGTGIDGSNALLNASPPVYFATCDMDPWAWPLTYRVFVSDTEVYLVCTLSLTAYPWLAFGTSPLPGVGGTGNWVSSVSTRATETLYVTQQFSWNYCYGYGSYDLQPVLMSSDLYGNGSNFIHVDIDGTGAAWNRAEAQKYTNFLCALQPNAWNGESILAPIQPFWSRLSNMVSATGAALINARYVRIDNYNPGDIITLGTDRWMVFPCWRKNAAQRDGSNLISNNTGTFGHAIRYDGP